jgi:hypothetical protein
VGGSVVDHRESNIIQAVCEYDVAAFESARGIKIGASLSTTSTELYSVVKSASPYTRVGTVWVDTYAPYASGGGQVSTLYWSCSAGPKYRLQRSAVFHTGLDPNAINGYDFNVREVEYFARIRKSLATVARQHMGAECKELTYSTFVTYTWAGFALHSDLYEATATGSLK